MRAALLALALLAGCVTPTEPSPEDEAPGMLLAGAPVRIDEARTAREPSIARLPDGTLFVAGYWGPARYDERAPVDLDHAAKPLLWRSDDGGATWTFVDVGASPHARGNSDVSLAVGPDGILYFANLVFAPIGETIHVGATSDKGATWTWASLPPSPFIDRPWVRIAPDGVAHLVWNDASGIHHAASTDKGGSWTEGPLALDRGGDGGFDVGPRGELAIRVVPLRMNGFACSVDTDGVLISTDAGATWALRELPGERPFGEPPFCGGEDVPRAWDPIAFDAHGALYALWAEGGALGFGRSEDLAATWSVTTIPTEADAFFPFLRGRAHGVAASWFEFADGRVPARAALLDREGRGGQVELSNDTGGADHGEYFEVIEVPGGLAAPVPRTEDGQWLDFVLARSSEQSS